MTIPHWPETTTRTDPHNRKRGSKFSVTVGQTTTDLKAEMKRLDPDEWSVYIGNEHTKAHGLPRHNANPDDPGVVIEWRDGEETRALGSDGYQTLAANLREAYLWLRETRKRNSRRITTAGADFAAAALPSGEDDGDEAISLSVSEAEAVLGVTGSAPDAAIQASFREQVKQAHGDTGGGSDRRQVQRLKQARNILIEE